MKKCPPKPPDLKWDQEKLLLSTLQLSQPTDCDLGPVRNCKCRKSFPAQKWNTDYRFLHRSWRGGPCKRRAIDDNILQQNLLLKPWGGKQHITTKQKSGPNFRVMEEGVQKKRTLPSLGHQAQCGFNHTGLWLFIARYIDFNFISEKNAKHIFLCSKNLESPEWMSLTTR